MRSFLLVCGTFLGVAGVASAQAPLATLVYPPPEMKLTHSGLAPAKIVPNLCLLRYRVSTDSQECQALFDQGLGYFYSYVWMEAARSFETATQRDPNCAMAWWGLSRALERWGRGKHLEPLKKAQELLNRAGPNEKLLITARLQEKGLITVPQPKPGADSTDPRKNAAIQTIDELLTLYDNDEEGWYYRAQLASRAGAIPYYKALLRVNPLHPGANHELVHFYEGSKRPALGWVPAEKYIESSPGIPHAFHMQAHLAMRLGRWDKTSDRSARAIDLERAYHKLQNVKPGDDWQYGHHLETLMLALIHDGRFREARVTKEEAKASNMHHWDPWFRLHLAERDWDQALKVADHFRKSDKAKASFLTALVYLKKNEPARAVAELEVLQQIYQGKKQDRQLETSLLEVQGQVLCMNGAADSGLKLLQRLVDRTKDDYAHHAWGKGAYYMEVWGEAALHANRLDVAEEAFLEAIAHDPGSVRGALGMQVLCERQGRSDEAQRFGELARRCWSRAEPSHFDAELAAMRYQAPALRTQAPAPDDKKTSARE